MFRSLVAVAIVAVLSFSPDSASADATTFTWHKRFGDATFQYGQSVAADAAGNAVAAGVFAGTIDLGNGSLTSAGSTDIYLVKYNAAGVAQWSKRFGDTDSQDLVQVRITPSGDIVIAGSFRGTVNFGGANLTATQEDIYIARFTEAGTHLWSKRIGGTASESNRGLAVDPSGNVIVCGAAGGAVDFGGGTLTNGGLNDFYVAKYDASGNHVWSRMAGDAQHQVAFSVTSDIYGYVYVGGYFQGSVDVGGGTLTSSGGTDALLAKFEASGGHLWSLRAGNTNNQQVYSVTTDPLGYLLATGEFEGTIDFGGGSISSTGGYDAYVVKLDGLGVQSWIKRFGVTGNQTGWGIASDPSERVLVTGAFSGTVDFGGGTITAGGSLDAFVARLDSNGNHEWSRGAGGAMDQLGKGIASDGTGGIVATGELNGSADFGGGTLTSAGSADAFVVRYDAWPAAPRILEVSDVGNDQGKQVLLRFEKSGHDAAGSATAVIGYEVYRRTDPLPAAASAPHLATHGPGNAHDRAALERASTPPTPLDAGWTYLGTVPAHVVSEYAWVAPTLADSTPLHGVHWSVFRIRAATTMPAIYYDSAPDSGYSLDNLAPSAPQNLAYGANHLTWAEAPETDFDYFSVFGSTTGAIDGSETLLGHTTSTDFDVSAAPYPFYLVAATDFSGNRGPVAVATGVTGVADAPSLAYAVSVRPIPSLGPTVLRFTLPRAGTLSLEILDVRGARIATLAHGAYVAGAHQRAWSGHDMHGVPVPSGVYFARATYGGETRCVRFAVVR